jgi:hypothetical protein
LFWLFPRLFILVLPNVDLWNFISDAGRSRLLLPLSAFRYHTGLNILVQLVLYRPQVLSCSLYCPIHAVKFLFLFIVYYLLSRVKQVNVWACSFISLVNFGATDFILFFYISIGLLIRRFVL